MLAGFHLSPAALERSLLIKRVVKTPRFLNMVASAQQESTPHTSSFTTLREGPHQLTTEVKKSKFIAIAWTVSSPQQALSLINTASDPTASHNCYAYRIGPNEIRSSDDGEPGGTAGRPILAAIEGESLDYVACLVTRHFGGIKLGTGGLVRAYGQAARGVLKSAPRSEVSMKTIIQLAIPLAVIGKVHPVIGQYGGVRMEEEYKNDGTAVMMTVEVEADVAGAFKEALANATSGQIIVR